MHEFVLWADRLFVRAVRYLKRHWRVLLVWAVGAGLLLGGTLLPEA